MRIVELDAGAVSEDELIDACARPLDWLTGATLCEASATVEQLDRFATTAFVSERVGTPGPDRPGFPVVVRDRVPCEDVQLQAGPAGAVAEASDLPIADQLRDWQESRRCNDWRAREATWRDVADGGCLDLAAAREQALTAQAELDGDCPVFETAADPGHPSHDGLCLDVRLRREGFIDISYHPVVTPDGRSGPVDEVTDP